MLLTPSGRLRTMTETVEAVDESHPETFGERGELDRLPSDPTSRNLILTSDEEHPAGARDAMTLDDSVTNQRVTVAP